MATQEFINQRFNRDTLTMSMVMNKPNAELASSIRGSFSNYTLNHMCEKPSDTDGDEYILVHGKLWGLRLLVLLGWKHSDLCTFPRLLIKPETEVLQK